MNEPPHEDQKDPAGQQPTPEESLKLLAEDYPGHRFWRARQRDGSQGSWLATRWDPDVGTDPTVMAADPDKLRAELDQQRKQAGQLKRLV